MPKTKYAKYENRRSVLTSNIFERTAGFTVNILSAKWDLRITRQV